MCKISFDTNDISSFKNNFTHTSTQVGNVGDMLSNTNKSAMDINQVNIDVVPDFSKLMGTLKDRGQI